MPRPREQTDPYNQQVYAINGNTTQQYVLCDDDKWREIHGRFDLIVPGWTGVDEPAPGVLFHQEQPNTSNGTMGMRIITTYVFALGAWHRAGGLPINGEPMETTLKTEREMMQFMDDDVYARRVKQWGTNQPPRPANDLSASEGYATW